MTRSWFFCSAPTALVAAVMLLDCSSGGSATSGCTPGDSYWCVCPGGGDGAKVCSADSSGYGACKCTGSSGSGSSGGSGSTSGGSSSSSGSGSGSSSGGSGSGSGSGSSGAPCPAARSGMAIAYDAVREVTVLFGGCANGTTNCNAGPWLNDTWEWNGTSWKNATPSGSSPSARASGTMVFDPMRQVTVFFGGGINYNATDYNDTWEWNGTAWTEVVAIGSAGAPPARNGPGMVWDPVKGVVVLFGGNVVGAEQLSDTWQWNGAAWSNVTPATSPPARAYFPMVFDTSTSAVMVWGGCSNSGCGAPLSDTWTWNGTTWTQSTASGPPAGGCSNCIAYHAATGKGILYGVSPAGSTWAWNGSSWMNVTPTTASPPGGGVLAYDSVRDRAVFFGGFSGGVPLAETWEWDGSAWHDVTPAVCGDQ